MWSFKSLRAALLVAVVVGTTAQAQILIGQTAGFTGAVAAGVKETTDGAKLYIDNVNAKGGINGQKIELISMDDKFDPKLADENARVLIEEKNVVAIFLNRGTPHSQAIIPWLDKHGVPLIAPSTGAMVLHQPVQKHVFNVRATYQREAEKAIAHLVTISMIKIAVIYVDDSFGQDGLVGAQKGLTAAGLTPVVLEKIDRAKPDFTKIVPEIGKSGAQAIMFIASGGFVAEGIKAIRAAGNSAQIVTLSNNASGGFIKSLGDNARSVIVSQVFPDSLNFAMVKEAQDMARAKDIREVSPAMLEGFAAAKVLVEALRRVNGKITRDKLQAVLDNFGKFDLGGLEVTYSPKDHTGLDFSDLSIISSSGKFRR
jgi:ABC-type branched-subunit amino acid transport system substrate-binding protein